MLRVRVSSTAPNLIIKVQRLMFFLCTTEELVGGRIMLARLKNAFENLAVAKWSLMNSLYLLFIFIWVGSVLR